MLKQLQEVLKLESNIGIITGKNPSIDEMAGALALYLSLNSSGKTVSVVSPTEPIVELSSLVGINKVKTRFDGGSGDLIVSFPYQEGEIDKVSYTLEDNYLNIVVKAGEKGLNFSENHVKFSRPGGVPKVVIVVGVPRLSDIQDLLNSTQVKDCTIVNIDNNEENEGYGDVVLVSQKMSSVSEAVANIIEKLELPMEKDIAQNLLSGISFATENFQNPDTSSLAFEMAGVLMRQGATRVIGRRQPRDTSFDFGLTQPQRQSLPQAEQKEAQKEDDKTLREDPFERLQKKLDEMKAKQSQETKDEPKKEIKEEQRPSSGENAPEDWLTPKIYKGSTNF